MVQEDALVPVVDLLNELQIPYMLVGGIALNYYSVPRLTHDADILIEMKPEHAQMLADRLKPAYHVDSDSVREAIESRREFNLIHLETGFKVDLWVLEDTKFDRLRFSRRVSGQVFGRNVFLSTPEDLILVKLVWFKESDSQKHYLDALGLYRAQGDTLQRNYLRDQAGDLSVAGLIKQLESDSGPTG
jgi:hypothetical protein